MIVLSAGLSAACGGAKAGPQPFLAPARTQPAASGAGWPTYHADNARTGVAAAGPALGHVNRAWVASVRGDVYAEPLVAGGSVIVATERDTVYSFDAATGHRRWMVRVGTPVPAGALPCGDISPVSGITSTPAIDAHTGVVYVVSYDRGFHHVLEALDLRSGKLRWRRRVDSGDGDLTAEQQRGALILSRGRVYITYGGLYGDCGRYHGWVVGAPASGPHGAIVRFRVPSANEGAIWAPPGPSANSAGDLFVATGNGSSGSFDFGNSVLRLSPALRRLGFFAPRDSGSLSLSDKDLGSTGPELLPGGRVFIIGKTGVGYLLNARKLGGIGRSISSRQVCSAAFGGDAVDGSTLYVPCVDGIFAIGANDLARRWSQAAATQSPIVAGNAVWAIGGGTLYQLDRRTGRVAFSAPIGDSAHFATPSASGGYVYAAAGGRLQAFR